MRRFTTKLLFGAALLAPVLAGAPVAQAAGLDGNWSVLIITEKGDCDQAYRYSVNVDRGHLKYSGDAAVNMDGTVADNGAVKVSIRLGEKGASGIGKLSGSSGGGTWQGAAANNSCAGRWEAEKR
ncbi:MAG: hypothetical protein ABI830_14985 [Pseudolabrys sp.]